MPKVDITGVNLKEFAKEVYNLSGPQGMGTIHYIPGPLSDDVAEEIVIEDGQVKAVNK